MIIDSLISIKCFQKDRQDTEESMKRGSLITIISSTSCSRMVLENHLLALGRTLFHIYSVTFTLGRTLFHIYSVTFTLGRTLFHIYSVTFMCHL